MSRPAWISQFVDEGCAIVPGVLDDGEVERWRGEIEAASGAMTDVDSVRDRGALYAIRNLFDVVPALRTLAVHPRVRALVEPVLGPAALLVKGLFFDKSADANWGVFWHQDLSVPIRYTGSRPPDLPDWGPWTRKGGVPSVQPPVEVLERMLTVRLHLDACTAENGPLRVLPGSHRHARLTEEETGIWAHTRRPVDCLCDAGAAVMMRPLLLHSSPKCEIPARRRVIHLEFATGDLPAPLEWHERVPIRSAAPSQPMVEG